MKNTIKVELFRAFSNPAFILSISIAFVLSFLQLYYAVSNKQNLLIYIKDANLYPTISAYSSWLGMDFSCIFTAAYFYLFPILVAVPFGTSYFEDLHGGYIQHIVTRSGKRSYFIAKATAIFFSAGFVFFLPLLFNFALNFLFFPAALPQSATFAFPLADFSMWATVFYSHPLLYNLGYLMIDFVYAGLYVLFFCFIFTSFFKNKYEIVFISIFAFFAEQFLFSWFCVPQWSSFSIIFPAQPIYHLTFSVVLFKTILAILFVLVFIVKKIRNDIL